MPLDDYADDSSTDATLAPGSIVTGSLEINGDSDWFRIELEAGSQYIFDLRGGSLAEPHLYVFHPSGSYWLTNRHGGPFPSGSTQVVYTPYWDETYFLSVEGYEGSYSGTYTLYASSANGPSLAPADDAADVAANIFSLDENVPPSTVIGVSAVDTVQASGLYLEDLILTRNESTGDWNLNYSPTAARSGADLLSGIERLELADFNVALDLEVTDAAGSALALLYASFNTIPDPEIFGIWIRRADELVSTNSYGSSSIIEPLAQAVIDYYAPSGLSHSDLVTLLYTNVVGIAPSGSEQAYYVGLLEDGVYTQASLYALAAELQVNTDHYVHLIGAGMAYLPDY